MFDRDYRNLILLATELGQFTGYLDQAEQNAQLKVKSAYEGERNRIVYEILSEKPDVEEVSGYVRRDLAEFAEAEPGYAGTIEFVAEDLTERLLQQSRSSALSRKVRRYAFPAIVVVLIGIYGGLWFYNHLTIDQPIEARDGMVQRAQAFKKVILYDELGGGRGGFIKGVLIAPFEPSPAELEAASEFAGLAIEGYAVLEEQGIACGGQHLLNENSDVDMKSDFVETVADFILDPAIKWIDPPVMTALTPISQRYPCGAGFINP